MKYGVKNLQAAAYNDACTVYDFQILKVKLMKRKFTSLRSFYSSLDQCGKKSHLAKKVMCYAPVNMNEKRINIRNNFR